MNRIGIILCAAALSHGCIEGEVPGGIAVTVDPSHVLGTVKTTAGSNHTGLVSFAVDPTSLVSDLSAIPYGLNRIHFSGDTPEGFDFDRLPQPTPTTWNFSALDEVVQVAVLLRQNGGSDFILAISYCPTWMTSARLPTGAPADNAVFAQYCERLVRYYNLGQFIDGDKTIVNPNGVVGIHSWEIWNEPDDSFLDGHPAAFSPQGYAAMFKTASAAMRAADPTIRIGGPNTAWDHQSYLDALTAAGAQTDFISIHQYWGESNQSDEALLLQARNVPEVTSTEPLPLVIGEINALWDWNDPRMAGSFELAYMPLAYMAHIEAGTPHVIRWETLDPAFPILNMDGSRHRNYWMERCFWSAVKKGSSRLAWSSTSPDIECLPLLEEGKLRIVVVNGADVRHDITIQGLPPTNYEISVVDRNTDPAEGPASTMDSTVSCTIDGYGIAVIRQH